MARIFQVYVASGDLTIKDNVMVGCSFSFENALVSARLPVRNLEEEKNVSMYITNHSWFHLTHGAPIPRGVTSMLSATSTPIPLVITLASGHMFVSDLRVEDLRLL